MSPHNFSGITFIGPALHLTTSGTIIVADLHLGAEAAIVGRGTLLPRTQRQQTLKTLRQVIAQASPERVVLAGDIKHEFGSIADEEWRDVIALLDELSAHAALSVVKGNHDALLLPILRKRGIEATSSLRVDEWLIMHGDQEPSPEELAGARGLIIGHEHPSLLLDDGVRKEKYKCFLTGTYKEKPLVVLPSLYPLVEGSDVLRERALGPVLKRAKDLHAHVVEGLETLYFGPLKDL